MIFVTVGTQINNFNRLFRYLDKIDTKERIIVQKGRSKYVFKRDNITSESFYSYEEMETLMNQAKIIITHGGPGTIFKALKLNKKVIVVPRLQKYHEIVSDNHQYEFCKYLRRKNYCMVAEDYDEFFEAIKNITYKRFNNYTNNVDEFADRISKEIELLLEV